MHPRTFVNLIYVRPDKQSLQVSHSIYHTCPICEKNTCFFQLKHGKKIVYTRHQRFLKHCHPYRRLKKAFNGSQENESVPKPLDDKEVYDRVKGNITIFRKTQKIII